METQQIDMLFLELSQFTNATTDKEIALNKEQALLKNQLKWAYCRSIGSDSIVGLDSCDNYKGWLRNLIK